MLNHIILPLAQATATEAESGSTNLTVQTQESTQVAISYLVTFATNYGLNIIGAIVILIAGSMISSFISKKVAKFVMKSGDADPSLGAIARKVVYAAFMVIVVIIVLGKFGVETASLIAVIGTAGLAIGLALQGTLSNVSDPYKPMETANKKKQKA